VKNYRCHNSRPDVEFISRCPSKAAALTWICVEIHVHFVSCHTVRRAFVEVNLGLKGETKMTPKQSKVEGLTLPSAGVSSSTVHCQGLLCQSCRFDVFSHFHDFCDYATRIHFRFSQLSALQVCLLWCLGVWSY
jgi:hypothetical protein